MGVIGTIGTTTGTHWAGDPAPTVHFAGDPESYGRIVERLENTPLGPEVLIDNLLRQIAALRQQVCDKDAELERIRELPVACVEEHAAAQVLERLRWGGRPACPQCGDADVTAMKSRDGTRNKRFLWRCHACRKQFTVRYGTIFGSSKIPLHFWCLAFYRACTSSGITARQLVEETGVSFRSALFMMARMRSILASSSQRPEA